MGCEQVSQQLYQARVSFETAARAFADPFLFMVHDCFDNGELSWQSLCMVDGHLVLLMAHIVGEDDEGTEILHTISARKADSKERKRYEQGREMRG